MPKDPSPLLGYNNNIRHKNRVFHVQTEDSGVRHPHIITHLFMDGGRILKSVKTSYADHLGLEKMAEVVQGIMKAQHKAMLVALRDGQYDPLVEGGAALAAKASPEPARARPPSVRPPSVRPASNRPPSARPAIITAAPDSEDAPPTARNPAAPAEELTLDIDALERAAEESSSPLFLQSDLPPPPATLFRERGGGGYSTVTGPGSDKTEKTKPSAKPPPLPTHGSPRSPVTRYVKGSTSRPPPVVQRRGGTPRPPPMSAGRSPARPPARPRSAPPSAYSDGRQGGRPAAAFGATKPPRGGSIFGEDLISDKSLDEVILSYLAEDLDAPGDKKK